MDDLEARLEKASEDFSTSKLYREEGLRFFPWLSYMLGVTMAPLVTAELKLVTGDIKGITPEHLGEIGEFPFQVAAAGYLSSSLAYELTFRRSLAGDKPRLGVIAQAAGIGATVAVANYFLSDSPISGGSTAGSLAFFLSKIAGDMYYDAEQAAPLKNHHPIQRLWHNTMYAYPQAVAVTGGIAGALLAPDIIGADSNNATEMIYDSVMFGTGIYAGRGLAGGLFRGMLNGYYSFWSQIADVIGRKEAKPFLAFEKLKLARTKAETVSMLEQLAESRFLAGDVLGALWDYEKASFLSDSPFIQERNFRLHAKKEASSMISELKQRSYPESIAKLQERCGREIALKKFEIAEAYASELSDITGARDNEVEGLHTLLLSITKKYDQLPAKIESYVRTIIPTLEEAAKTESVSESRHAVWKVDGVVPGYLRRMESPERAQAEYNNALFFYEYFKGRMPEPIPPIEMGGKSYIFSRSFGEGNLLDKIRAGKATYQDMSDSVNLLIEMQNAAAHRLDLPDPLYNEGYLMRRFEHCFLDPFRGYGVKITQEQEAILRNALTLLQPNILELPRGIYRDLNTKNIVDGPAGTKVPIDWEELTKYPIQKDVLKLLMFGGYYIDTKPFNEFAGQIVRGTHEAVAPKMSFSDYKKSFKKGMWFMAPLVHLDMAGYIVLDTQSSTDNDFINWGIAAQKSHLSYSAAAFYDIYRLADDFGIQKDMTLLEAENVLEEIVGINYEGVNQVMPFISDRRRPFFRALFQKEEHFLF
ncbi:MAG: hypothetical protein AABX51_04180 [Nanoarchaeota archaeon]